MVFRGLSATVFAKGISVTALTCTLFLSSELYAHSDHDKQIHQLDEQLQQLDSANHEMLPALLRRADLHRREQHWDAALHDYEKIAKIKPSNADMLLGMAQLHLDQNDFLTASQWSVKMLERNPHHVQALMMHARAQAGLGNLQTVTELYGRAFEHMKDPKPKHYIEYASAVLQSQNEQATNEAIAIADKGANRLNHPVSLHSFALEQELQSNQFEAAAQRIDSVVARNPRLWHWQLKKAELLITREQFNAACVTLQTLEDDLQQLPPRRSKTPAMLSIKSNIDDLQLYCANE